MALEQQRNLEPVPAQESGTALEKRSRNPAEEARALLDRALACPSAPERLQRFREAYERDLNDPFAMSYYGRAVAEVQHQYQQGIVFCEEAVRRMGPHPDLLVNLARAYLAAKNKREAVRALRRAMARGVSPAAQAELVALGIRRRPVIPFLPRGFFLNKYLGLLRHRLLHRQRSRDDGTRPIPAELGRLSGDVDEMRRLL